MNGQTDKKFTDEVKDGQMGEWIDGQKNRCTDSQADRWMKGYRDRKKTSRQHKK